MAVPDKCLIRILKERTEKTIIMKILFENFPDWWKTNWRSVISDQEKQKLIHV